MKTVVRVPGRHRCDHADVRGDHASGVDRDRSLAQALANPPASRRRFRTDLFAQIRRYQDEDWVRDVVVEFDPQLGYPTSIGTFSKAGIMDAGATQFVRNLVPTP